MGCLHGTIASTTTAAFWLDEPLREEPFLSPVVFLPQPGNDIVSRLVELEEMANAYVNIMSLEPLWKPLGTLKVLKRMLGETDRVSVRRTPKHYQVHLVQFVLWVQEIRSLRWTRGQTPDVSGEEVSQGEQDRARGAAARIKEEGLDRMRRRG
jgi:hypothetical protein